MGIVTHSFYSRSHTLEVDLDDALIVPVAARLDGQEVDPASPAMELLAEARHAGRMDFMARVMVQAVPDTF